jgi:hypothetical protein
MSDDEEPVALGPDEASPIQELLQSALVNSGGDSTEVDIPPIPGPVSQDDPPTQAPTSTNPSDAAPVAKSIDQKIRGGRDAYAAGRDLIVHVHDSDGSEEDRAAVVRLFSKSQRTDVADSYLQQAVKQAEVTFRMSVWFITAGGLVVIAAIILSLIHPSTPHSVSFVSGLVGLLIGGGGGAFAIRADKSRKHLAEAMKQVDAEVQEERRFEREAWRYDQATKAISDIRDDKLNDQARVELARLILGASQLSAGEAGKTPTPEPVSSAVDQEDDASRAPSIGRGRRRRPTF